jgi:hypothetical protein
MLNKHRVLVPIWRKEKIMSLDKMELVEKKQDNIPSTDDDQSIVWIKTIAYSQKEIEPGQNW